MAKAFKGLLAITSVAGGGGAVLSAGLLRRLNCSLYVSCVHGNETKTRGAPTFGGGDGLLTVCLWRQGFGYTDPGIELRHRQTFAFNTYQNKLRRMRSDLEKAAAGGCGARCQLKLRHTVSLHAHGARMANHTEGAAGLASLLRSAAEYAARSSPLEQLVRSAAV
ncbi:hypothetical protein ABPG77_004573 [Micractinium sp. CCAP 211/92]